MQIRGVDDDHPEGVKTKQQLRKEHGSLFERVWPILHTRIDRRVESN